jgi:hypothetical protein
MFGYWNQGELGPMEDFEGEFRPASDPDIGADEIVD